MIDGINTCVHWVYPTNEWGKMPKRKCEKIAIIQDGHKRDLCKSHYDRFIKKKLKRKIKNHIL